MTTIRPQPIERHEVHSHRLFRHAREQLELGDRLQASEKAWGAVAHALEPIADKRGWKYTTHADAFTVARNLAREQDDPRIMDLFSIAHGLRIDYYEDLKPIDFLSNELERAEELLNILWHLMDD